MGRMVMIAGAGDAAGLRLTKDFLKAGDTVIAGLLTGQGAATLPEGMESVTIDPLSDSSAKRAAAEVAKKHPAIDLLVVNYDCCTKSETWTILDAPDYAAMNQLFNGLRPKGYTFRMYCKDPATTPERAGEYAVEYFTRNRSNEPEPYKHSDENRLVLRDWMNIEIPW